MKQLLLIFTLALAIHAQAQYDRVTLINGKSFVGTVHSVYTDRLVITDNDGVDWMILQRRIYDMQITHETGNGTDTIKGLEFNRLSRSFNAKDFTAPREYNKKAWQLFAGGGAALVVGGILTGVGTYLQTTTTTTTNSHGQQTTGRSADGATIAYAGYTCLTASFCLDISSLIMLFKSGKEHSYQVPQ